MESIAPNIFVNNLPETIAFYQKVGFSLGATVPDESPFIFAMMSCGEVVFMFQTFESLGEDLPEISRRDGGSLVLYIKIDHIRKFFEDIKGQVTILKGLETTFYGATEFSILDNNGYVLTFAEDEQQEK